jgi:AbiV family abortive infection protein
VEPAKPNLAYHFGVLALEEVGKAGLIMSHAALSSARDDSGIEKWLSSHTRKLLWALWTPLGKIDPANFNEAKVIAERLHSQRLAGLYVDPSAELSPPKDAISRNQAQSVVDLAQSTLNQVNGRAQARTDDTRPELLEWFLQTLEDPENTRRLFSASFLAKYEEFGRDATRWAEWARSEFDRLTAEADAVMRHELARRPVEGDHHPKWRVRIRVHTISHSVRPKILKYWNDRVEVVKFISVDKKDEFIIEHTLNDVVLLPDLHGRAFGMSKMILAFLSIGSIGFFWFDKPAFAKRIFEDVKDLTRPTFRVEIGPHMNFWDGARNVALTEQHIEHAMECMSTYMPMDESAAEPIFAPYFYGLALMAKTDLHVATEELGRTAFIASLGAALRHYGAWDGGGISFRDAVDRAFEPIIPDVENRTTVFRSLNPHVDRERTPFQHMITAKHLVDLFLIRTAREQWQKSLSDWAKKRARSG